MKRILFLVFIFAITAAPRLFAGDRMINVQVSVREKEANSDSQFVLIEEKNLQFIEGVRKSSFIVNFTLDLTATYDDSGYFHCEFSAYTLGPQAQTFFKKFRSQPGGVYFLEGVRGKNETIYRVGISPVSVDSMSAVKAQCAYDYRGEKEWQFDPSAHFDFYYIPQSLADARWNLLRDFVEINYKDFKEAFQFGFPGKINYFLAPCILDEVNWDVRMGYAIDPPRGNCLALYNHDHNTVDAFPAILVRIYRYLGYAPPILAEGMAAYFDFPHYYARELRRQNKLPQLPLMIKAVDYFRLPENDNISAASSFVKFLLDTYGYSKFKNFYDEATDLSFERDIKKIYDRSLSDLENEWHELLDTTTFKYGNYRYFYEREKYIYRDYGMNRFLAEMRKRMPAYEDSVYTISEAAWNDYMRANYIDARDDYRQLIDLAPANSNYPLILGHLYLIDGNFDSALTMYDRVLAMDSGLKTALYKKGETYYYMGQIDSARFYLLRDIGEDISQLSNVSASVLMAQISLAEKDTAGAAEHLNRALALMEQIYQYGKSKPAFLLRLGEVHLGLAMCGESSYSTARSFLETALFLEVHPTRVIFVTRILRELGKLSDLEGKRDAAIGYYQQALSYPLPPYFEAEVRSYIEKPFTGY